VLRDRRIDRVIIWLHEADFHVAHLCQLRDRLSQNLSCLDVTLVVVLIHKFVQTADHLLESELSVLRQVLESVLFFSLQILFGEALQG